MTSRHCGPLIIETAIESVPIGRKHYALLAARQSNGLLSVKVSQEMRPPSQLCGRKIKMTKIKRIGLAIAMASVLVLPLVSATIEIVVDGDTTTTTFESADNPEGTLGMGFWGSAYSYDPPYVTGSPSALGTGVNYQVLIFVEEGRVCRDGDCRDIAWDQFGCRIESYVATGYVSHVPKTITRNGYSYDVYLIDFNYKALTDASSCWD